MSPDLLSRRTIAFVNVAHALDHFVLLIYPTAVIAIAAERHLSYASLIGLSTGAFVASIVSSLRASSDARNGLWMKLNSSTRSSSST